MVPFADLKAETLICREAIDAGLRAVIESHHFIGGEMVAGFEREMALHQGQEEIVACANGTDALWLTLRALGIGPGDEVIVPPCTAMPTAEAVTLAGARVVFADAGPGGFHLDPDRAEAAITPRTRALLPVHLYGVPADLDRLAALARARGLFLVEDCAQAQGARWRGARVGTFGDAACFSFFPSKALGCFGDGGAMTARDPAVRRRQRMLADHGRASKFDHLVEGTNSRLDALQAAVLRAKLPLLDERNALRRRAAAWYAEKLAGLPGVTLPSSPDCAEPVWHVFPIRVADRESLRARLREASIETGLHYPKPLHRQPAYERLGLGEGSLPHAEAAFREELSLPMFPAITEAQVAEVAAAIRAWARG